MDAGNVRRQVKLHAALWPGNKNSRYVFDFIKSTCMILPELTRKPVMLFLLSLSIMR